MKSLVSSFLLFAAAALAATNSTDGPSCGVPGADDSYFSVVGIQGTGIYPRQELRELEKDTETWNMFLQAFARFQAMDQDEKISYFQIAGEDLCTIWSNTAKQHRNTRCPFQRMGRGQR
jgi:tyrosinase